MQSLTPPTCSLDSYFSPSSKFLACKHAYFSSNYRFYAPVKSFFYDFAVLAITFVQSSEEPSCGYYGSWLSFTIEGNSFLKSNLTLEYSSYAYAFAGVKKLSNSAETEEAKSLRQHRITRRFLSDRFEMEMSLAQCLT